MEIRHAIVQDAPAICELINYYAERGRMLHRSLESVYQALREFIVAIDESGWLVGCVAVDIYWADLAEVVSMAVAESARGKGIGRMLLDAAMNDARRMGVTRIFALTYEQAFFEKGGFTVIDRDQLPEKVWRVCLHCPKKEHCDEIAMARRLEP